MKIVVEEGQAESPLESAEQDRKVYEVDLDYEGAVLLVHRLRSSGSYIHFEGETYKIHFRLDPGDPIEIEIMSIVDDFWAMSEVSDDQAESILGVAYRGERFSGVIPGTELEWGAWSDRS